MKKLRLQLGKTLKATGDELDWLSHLICGTKQNLDDSGVPLYEIKTIDNNLTVQASDGCYDDVKEDLTDIGFTILAPLKIYRILDKYARAKMLALYSHTPSQGFLESELPTTIPNFSSDSNITIVDLKDYPITYINENNSAGFNNCAKIKTIILPDACKTLSKPLAGYGAGSGVLSRCTSLERLDFGGIETINTEGLFCYSKYPDVVVIAHLKTYGPGSFWCFSGSSGSIKKLVVGSIELFLSCYFVTAGFTMHNPKLYIVGDEENNITEINIPSTLTEIKQYALYNLQTITKVTFPESITSVGTSAFYNCVGLTEVNFPSVLWWLKCSFANEAANPMSTFKKMVLDGEVITSIDLTEIDPDKEVTAISSYNLADNLLLTKFTTHTGILSVDNGAFYNCTSLSTVKLNDAITNIGSYAFYNTIIPSFTTPKAVTTIGSNAFLGCTKLKVFYSSDTYNTVNANTFYGCTALTKVSIPAAVTIGSSINQGSGMSILDLGPRLTTIGQNLFYSDSATSRALIIRNLNSIPTLTTTNFNPTHIFVPQDIIDKYKLVDTTWRAYVSKIYPIGGKIWENLYSSSDVYADLNETEIAQYNSLFPSLYTNYKEKYIDTRSIEPTSLEIQWTTPTLNTYTSLETKTISVPKGKIVWLYSNFDNNYSDLIEGNMTWTSASALYTERYGTVQAHEEDVQVTCACNNLSDIITIKDSGEDTYIEFEDEEVARVLVRRGVYTEGILKEEVGNITSIEGWFGSNKTLKKFNEFKYFTGVKSANVAFNQCTNLEEVTLPTSLTTLNSQTGYVGMFDGCTHLKRLDLGGLTYVNIYHHFEGAVIETLILHVALTQANSGRTLFSGVKNIVVDDISILLKCSIPNTGHSFSRAGTASIYYTSDESTVVGTDTNPLIIPKTVTSIGAYTLYNISTIVNLQYEGTSTEWASVTKGTSWNYNLGTSTIYCIGDETTVTL